MLKEQDTLDLALKYHELGNLIEAEKLYKEILQHNSSNDSALYFLGVLACQLRQRKAAADYFRKAASAKPCLEYYKDLANILFDLEEREESLDYYQKVLEYSPEDTDVYFNMALLCQQLNNVDGAINCFEKVIKLNPNDFQACLSLGNIYANLKLDNLKAITFYEKTVAINSQCVDAFFALGILYSKINEFDKALSNYQNALYIKPDCAEIYYNLGDLFEHKGMKNEAVTCYKKAIELKPDFIQACNQLEKLL